MRRPIPFVRASLALFALLGSSAVCLTLLMVRAWGLNEHGFGFIPFNLLLAWIPMLAATVIYSLHVFRKGARPLAIVSTVVWFLFYPNAPYLTTDLVHLQRLAPVPHFFDILMMMSVAWTGLFLGNLSLYLMQEVVRSRWGWVSGWIFAVSMMAVGSIGVFFGRFLRWNSWEAVVDLGGLASKAATHLHGLTVPQAAGFSVTFFAFSVVTYTTLYTVAHLHFTPAPLQAQEMAPGQDRENTVAMHAGMQ